MGEFSRLIAVLMVAAVPLMAVGKTSVKHTKPGVRQPDPALLEFLGTWESSNGQWVDPMIFARINPGQLPHKGKLPAGVGGRQSGKPEQQGGNGV